MKLLTLLILLTSVAYSLKLNQEQINNVRFIYSKTINKDYAALLAAIAFHESSLKANKINKCDLKYKKKCYDSVGLFQVNMHTAALFYPNAPKYALYQKLKKRNFSLKMAKMILGEMQSYATKKTIEKTIERRLQIYNGGVRNRKTNYSNKIYKTYLKFKKKEKEWV